MTSRQPGRLGRPCKLHRPLAAVALTVLSMAVQAQSQDASKALNALQQLLRPAQGGAAAPANVVPALPVAPAAAAGQMAPKGTAQAAQTQDLFQLLNQAGDTIDEPREIEIGRQLAAVLLGSKPLHPDTALQRYVNQLGRWISLQSTRPELPWTFAVLDDVGYNAFAAPGGYIFVTKGLIDRVSDEAELAGILAHEITHVVQRHHLKAMRKTARAGALTQLIGSQLNNSLGGALSAQLLALGRNLYAKGLDQEDEFEADRMGIALAASAGFDPYGLMAALQPLRTATADNPAFALTLSTHPPAQARMDQAELAMGNRLDALSGKLPITVTQRLQQIAAAEQRRNASAAAPAAAAPTPSIKPAAKPVAKPPAKPAASTTRKTP
jgi:predicted Zn-dependent protease